MTYGWVWGSDQIPVPIRSFADFVKFFGPIGELMKVVIENKEYAVVYDFGNGRVIVDYDGVYVMADRIQHAQFEFSGEPARQGEELDMLNKLVKDNEGTTVTVTKEDP